MYLHQDEIMNKRSNRLNEENKEEKLDEDYNCNYNYNVVFEEDIAIDEPVTPTDWEDDTEKFVGQEMINQFIVCLI